MRKLASLLLFFAATACLAGPAPGAPVVPSITIGGRVITDVSNLISLSGYVGGATTGNTSLRKPGASSGYQVPAGKNFYIVGIIGNLFTTYSGNGGAGLCYADNDVGLASNTGFTNIVNLYAGNQVIPSLATGVYQQSFINTVVPALKYPCFSNYGASTGVDVTVYGYEQ